MDYNSEEKILGFLRSVFRYKRIIDKNAPEQLLSMEKIILQDKLKLLTTEELFEAIMYWNEFYEKTIVSEEIEDERTMKDLDSFMLSLN